LAGEGDVDRGPEAPVAGEKGVFLEGDGAFLEYAGEGNTAGCFEGGIWLLGIEGKREGQGEEYGDKALHRYKIPMGPIFLPALWGHATR
jgi:hypothetical protein